MPEAHVNGTRLYFEEQGEGAPIVCIHGAGSSALAWADAAQKLARLGRVIVYDRRGWDRSDRPEPYERTTVTEQADDAAALLDALSAVPAIVIGRSLGGAVAVNIALRYPSSVQALILLEPTAPRELAPAAAEWVDTLAEHVRAVAAEAGVAAVGEALISGVGGQHTWRSLPDELRRMLTENAPAILADLRAHERPETAASALATIDQPALLVAATDSPPAFHEAAQALAAALPNARLSRVDGGHMVDPASPQVIAFLEKVLHGQ